jgi:N-acetylmuramoyl-L-alanine amidase
MPYDRIVISSGHAKKVRGASGYIDEVDEARKVVEHLAIELRNRGVEVKTYHDDVSTTQNENLNRIVDYHNAQVRELDVSVHFNAHQTTSKPMGTEVLYQTQYKLAEDISLAISANGFINRGAKKRTDLFFLNHTAMPAVLLEICFVDSQADADLYKQTFDSICVDIADVLGGVSTEQPDETVPPPETVEVWMGTCSHFGGPNDTGVSDQEGLAFIYDVQDAPYLFLPEGTPGTQGMGLARRLNTEVHYCAMRFDYEIHPKKTLLSKRALVRNPLTGIALTCIPADWGPHEEKTGRLIDLSPSMMRDLNLETDDLVEVIFPYAEGEV